MEIDLMPTGRFYILSVALLVCTSIAFGQEERNKANNEFEQGQNIEDDLIDLESDDLEEDEVTEIPDTKAPRKRNLERLFIATPGSDEITKNKPAILQSRFTEGDGKADELHRIINTTKTKGVWRFKDEPLDLAVERIATAIGVPIILDEMLLSEIIDIDDYPLISATLMDITIEDVLDIILRQVDEELTYAVRNNVFFITTKEEASYSMKTRIYKVGDLVKYVDQQGKTYSDPNALGWLITVTIEPDSWDELGGEGRLGFFEATGIDVFVVSQTDNVHAEILAFLSTLRKLRNSEEYEKGPRERHKQTEQVDVEMSVDEVDTLPGGAPPPAAG